MLEDALAEHECPIINADPCTLYDVLKDCVAGKYDLEDLGRRSRAYVEKFYGLEAVAARLAQLYVETAGFPQRVQSKLQPWSERASAIAQAQPAS